MIRQSRKVIRGEDSLPRTVWLYGLAGSFLVFVLGLVLQHFIVGAYFLSPHVRLAISAVVLLSTMFIYPMGALVAIWLCASRHTDKRFWAAFSKIASLVLFSIFAFNLVVNIFSWSISL